MANLTDQQAAAVAAEGNVLVMAGAGTGKTSTLVARVLDRLTRPGNPIRADRILMATFTEAAAAEMRSRLRAGLEAKAEEEGIGSTRLLEQVARLELASIGTLHGFCLQLLREHGTRLGLEPQLLVLDEVESGRLAVQVWRRQLERALGDETGEGADFRAMVDGWFDGEPGALWDTVRAVTAYVRTLADPDGWLREQEAVWHSEVPTVWSSALAGFLPSWAAAWGERLSTVVGNPLVDARRNLLLSPEEPAGSRRAWFEKLRERESDYPPRKKGVLRAPLAEFFKEVEFLRTTQPTDDGPDPLSEDWARCRPWMQCLLRTVREFLSGYQLEKRSRGGVDFADLEQYALDLLVRQDTGVGQACRDRFDLVVVDECQDLNAAQEAILTAVSRPSPGANRFLVGDVKQSIYRFRLADPRLFQATASRWGQTGADGQVIPLTGNFRSAESLLDFVNTVCCRLFRPDVGGVGYGRDAALVFGDPTGRTALARGADPWSRVEWHVRVRSREAESSEDTGEPDPGSTAEEAGLVARRLREIHASGRQVWDRKLGGLRPVQWSDMAVLLRAERGRAADYVEAFQQAGVPLQARQSGFFALPVVMDLRNLLRVLDNPLQDIPLGGLLRSPLVGLTDPDTLAVIRMLDRAEKRWWPLLQRFHETGSAAGLPSVPEPASEPDPGVLPSGAMVFHLPALSNTARDAWERIGIFLGRHARWRRIAVRSGAAAALEAALDETGYEGWAAGLHDGGEARANLRRFLEMARRFDRGSRGGLYRFLVWLDAEEAADRTEPALGDGGAAVQLMTVHRSKGLEFPVVAVAGLGARFRLTDLTQTRLVRDEVLGLCPAVVDGEGRRYPSVGLWLAQRRQRRETLGEELRLLYVALTRAADLLLLFGTASEKAAMETWVEAAGALGDTEEPMDEARLVSVTSTLGWLGPLLVARAGPGWASADEGLGNGFSWRRWRELPAPLATDSREEPATRGEADEPVDETGATPLAYPHWAATREPAKVTATGLRRRYVEDALDLGIPDRKQRAGGSDPLDGSAVDRGLAHHLFMEHVDPARTVDRAGLEAERDRMLAVGALTAPEVALLDMAAIDRFWQGELGREIRQRPADLRRELPFTVRLTAADLGALGFTVDPGLSPEEFVVGQGVVDLAVIGSDGILILDFKTDRVSGGRETQAKAEHYRPQLAVYALALSRIHGLPVRGRWLHFLATGENVPV